MSEPPRELESSSELTNGQFIMWTAQKLAPDTPCFNMMFAFEIEGDLDGEHFGRAFQGLIDRCDILRTLIVEVDGAPRQRVLPRLEHEVERVDLTGEADPTGAAKKWLHERGQTPLALERRLFDTALLQTAPARFLWFLNLHHIATDGLAYALVYGRMAELYALSLEGRLDEAPESPRFQDYVAFERRCRESDAYHEAEARWREKLEPRLDAISFYGNDSLGRNLREHRISRRLGEGLMQRLDALAERSGFRSLNRDLSLLNIFSAALFAYLHRISGHDRLSIGIPFHNRATDGERETIGLLQQTYPVQVEIGAEETFASLASKSMRGIWEVMRGSQHGLSDPKQDGAYDVMLNCIFTSFSDFAGLPTTATRLHTGFGDGNHSLFVQVRDFNASGALTVDLDFNDGVFDEGRRKQSSDHFLQVLDQVLADPDAPIAALHLLTAEERRRILVDFNDTRTDYPRDSTIKHLFEAQAEATPSEVAVTQAGTDLTYAELDARANQWGHLLRASGVGPRVPVAMCAGQSLETLAALLGIFKAGGAYVPLDPTHPAERLAFIVSDANCPILLTEEGLIERLPPHDGEVIRIDGDAAAVDAQPRTAPEVAPTPADLAYVIYTSGSTGKPKGGSIPQRGLVNVIWWQMHAASRVERPRTLQATPLTFDVSLQEIFATWCCGGTVVLPVENLRRDPERLLRVLIDERIEQLFMIFTPLQKLAEASERLELAPETLREVYTAGEQVQITPAVARFFDALPDCRFHNQYGSAEDFIATAYTLPGSPDAWPPLPPIGVPIANTQIHILDDQLEPTPVGIPGEICLGGDQVADGYLNRPGLTAEKFIPNPFASEPGERLFRTGDVGTFLPDGNIEFLGRADYQIKLRGYRIELGEIEAVLGQHEAVRKTVVLAREDRPGEKRLVAYVSRDADPADAHRLVPALRAFLAERLPDHMIPSAFVLLDELPLTPSGKIDRLALPEPAAVRPELESDFVAPRSEAERVIAGVWRKHLQVDRVGLNDPFFSLGGHSLLLVEVHRDLRRLFDRELSVLDLFDLPTVADLAEFLAGAESKPEGVAPARERGEAQRQALRNAARRPPLPSGHDRSD